ncbi:RNA-directed DNA polymerase, eukaryota, reverse transcriptase zinc-binding domain protein [Tanacetum coccineum]|uniref:RNA-directed DNA polymerase, eukaryota, reverse transcriptase zinc-binding domain protein n=1 Tax=Tanacetum coccineum TaxID=301880 RepID=A0ABQ5H5T4_9ASTR
MHDGTWITDPPQIKDAFLNFLKEKFQAHDSHIIFSPLVHSTGLCLNDRDFLEIHVTLKEVKIAVWDCGSNKSLGTDGFSFSFVKKYWDLLKKDIFKFVDSFLASGMIPQGANSSFFMLILNVSNPIHIKDFHPIPLIGIQYKIIAKILANREVIDWFKKIKKKMLIFKVDFKKAFDSVSWKYLDFVLLISSGLIRGIKIGSSNITLSYLFYAYDVIITTDWNSGDLDNIIRVLHVFYLASGLKINIHKSNIFGIGVPNGDVVDMARRTSCASGIFPFTYLGLLIGLFRLDPDKDCFIIDRISNGQWKWNWSREDISVRNKSYLRELLLEISLVDIIMEEDSCVWDMAIEDIFLVGDTRRLIDAKILPTLVPPTSWDKTLPRKVNILIWRLALDRLPRRLNLSAQGMDITSIACPSCNGNVESSSHIFFYCDFAKEIWRLIRSWYDFPLPTFTSYGHWRSCFTSWQAPKQKSPRLYIIVFASFWWIWRFNSSVIFCPHPLRKGDMFDNIRSLSFYWLSYRGRMSCS